MNKILVIVGPTASGKSAIGVQLAKQYNGEIISGDSVQVYRQLKIGCAKITKEEMMGIEHHLIDCLDYNANYSVYDFQKQGRAIITEIKKKAKLPIVVGGTGLYIKALIYDYEFPEITMAEIDYSGYNNEQLLAMIAELDQSAAEKLHVNNRKRLISTMKLLATLDGSKTDFLAAQKKQPVYDTLIIGLTMNRKQLHERINSRVEAMWQGGLADEVAGLVNDDMTVFDYQSMQAIGYREFKDWYTKVKTPDEVKEKIKNHTRQFAKRQYSWFNNQMPVIWFDISEAEYIGKITTVIENWLQEKRNQ